MITKSSVKYVVSSFCLLASFSAQASPWFLTLSAAGGLARLGKNQNVVISPDVTNRYVPDNENEFAGLISVTAGHHFHQLKRGRASLGLQGGVLNYGSFTGKIHPLVNIAPDFDTLKYEYSVESYLLMLVGQWTWFTSSAIQPYFSAAVGTAKNKMYSYSESPVECSSAAPSIYLFKKHYNYQFAYALGLGISTPMAYRTTFEIGYLYVNTGHARLNPPLSQPMQGNFGSGLLASNFIQAGISFS